MEPGDARREKTMNANGANRIRGLSAVFTCAVVSSLACPAPKSVAEEHFARWRAVGPRSYHFVLEEDCLPGMCPPLRMTVRNGKAVQIIDEWTGQPASGSQLKGLPLTIDDVFRKLVAIHAEPPKFLRVNYDLELAYPTRIRFEQLDMFDGGWNVDIRDLALEP